jgi:uncharacterized protein YdgA (DUF945 family)
VKKGIVALFIILAMIIVISPGIVGRLAEKTVDENIEWAQEETPEIRVTSERFDRGWFSSEGQHRVEITNENLRNSLLAEFGDHFDGGLPVLIIDTRLDHGLIPVTSMTREKGSLVPGLGSAISTLSFEMPNGDVVKLPGTIYSEVGLAGELDTNLVLDAGTFDKDGATAAWGATDISVVTRPSGNVINYEGSIASFRVVADGQDVEIGGLTFVGDQRPTRYGFAMGDMQLEIQSISTVTPASGPMTIGPFSIDARSAIVDDRINAETKASIAGIEAPGLGEIGMQMDVGMTGLEPRALGAVADALDALNPDEEDPQLLFAAAEKPLMDLVSAGMQLDVRQLDIKLPQGTIATKISATIQESDRDNFVWTALLLATEGVAEVSISREVMEFAMAMNPQAGMAVGMGFLKLNGDVYELQAEYKKGLMTVNGAPMPIPLPGQ